VGDARKDLRGSLRTLYEVGDEVGLAFAMAGTHPFAQWREQDIFPNERYARLVERIQWPARRLLIYGLHVHVGVGSGEKAIAFTNALTTYIPHLLALSASSPFLGPRGLRAGERPRQDLRGDADGGAPGPARQLRRVPGVHEHTHQRRRHRVDPRDLVGHPPHPDFGTVEVRVCDIPATLSEVCALAALVQALVGCLDEAYDDGEYPDLLHAWVVRENKWRAARHGLDADIIVTNKGMQRPLRQDILRLLEEVAPVAERLGCPDELAGVYALLEQGSSSERQRRVFAETGQLDAVVRALAAELRADVLALA
jgi:glutamate---cysteine ligase / carboxylate-amine ligase